MVWCIVFIMEMIQEEDEIWVGGVAHLTRNRAVVSLSPIIKASVVS